MRAEDVLDPGHPESVLELSAFLVELELNCATGIGLAGRDFLFPRKPSRERASVGHPCEAEKRQEHDRPEGKLAHGILLMNTPSSLERFEVPESAGPSRAAHLTIGTPGTGVKGSARRKRTHRGRGILVESG